MDPLKFTATNQRFHKILYRRCPNRHLLTMVVKEWELIETTRRSAFEFIPERAIGSVAEHERLLQLIEAGRSSEEIEAFARRSPDEDRAFAAATPRQRDVRRDSGRRAGAMRFRSNPSSIRGSIAPVVTPFTADGEMDHDSLRRLVQWQLASGSHGISLGGSTGEPSAQTVAERIAAMRVVADEVADRVPFLPGTGSAKLDETLELTEAAISLGADAALVITPYYSRPTQEGLYQWYSTVARTFPDMPIVLYNVPIRTAVDVAPETVATAAPRSRQHRRRQGDHEGLRALLAGVPPLRSRHVDVVGHRTAVPAVARARRDRVRQRSRQSGAERGRQHVRLLGRGRHREGARHPLRPAPARRPDVRRDQSGTDQERARAWRPDHVRIRASATGDADARLGLPASTRCSSKVRRCSNPHSPSSPNHSGPRDDDDVGDRRAGNSSATSLPSTIRHYIDGAARRQRRPGHHPRHRSGRSRAVLHAGQWRRCRYRQRPWPQRVAHS